MVHPKLYDVPLEDGNVAVKCRDDLYSQCGDGKDCCQEKHKNMYTEDSISSSEKNCCSAKTWCTLLTILVFIFAGLATGFAIFSGTRVLSIQVFLPLVLVSLFSCIGLMCCMSCRENDLAIIEPTDLPLPKMMEQKSMKEIETFDTSSTESESNEEKTERERYFAAKNFPEFHNFLQQTSKSFDKSRTFVINRFIRPAAILCAPTTQVARCSSVGALSVDDILGPDIECCVDVYCLRDEFGAINLTGTYKLIHNHNFEEFLGALNIPMIARKAANSARPIHKYTHVKDHFRVQIEGIIKGDSTYTINGPPVPSKMRHQRFLDHVSYLEDKKGVMTRKVLQNHQKSRNDSTINEIIVTRTLSKNGQRMIMTSKALRSDRSEIAIAVQTFVRTC